MLEKPDLQEEKIIDCLHEEYRLHVAYFEFLPLGVDLNTAVYRALNSDKTMFFVKLRRGYFDKASVLIPKFLHDHGINQIIVPISTKSGKLWASLNDFKVILYPFIDGCNGYEKNLLDHQWCELGTALKNIHTMNMPASLTRLLQKETYSPQWRKKVKKFLVNIDKWNHDDPIVQKLSDFLKDKHTQIIDLTERAEQHAQTLKARSPIFTLCHADLHAGNILITAKGNLYIVDWDNPILALKERDLMFAGGGQFGDWRTHQEEETLFYQGYGSSQIDTAALAYYRYERIVQDIAVECEQIFMLNEGKADREQAFQYLRSNFLPNHVIELAYQCDKTL